MARAPPAARDAAMPPKKSKKEQLAAGRQKLEAFKRQKMAEAAAEDGMENPFDAIDHWKLPEVE